MNNELSIEDFSSIINSNLLEDNLNLDNFKSAINNSMADILTIDELYKIINDIEDKLTIDEINDEIDSLEKDTSDYINSKDERLKIREKKHKKKLYKSLLINLMFLTGAISLGNKLYDYALDKGIYLRRIDRHNIYDDNNLKLSDEEKEELINQIINEYEIDENSYNENDILLLNALILNSNLTDSQKEVAAKIINIARDNKYLDFDLAYERLYNLITVNKDRPIYLDKYVTGRYITLFDKIELYNDDLSNDTFTHELVHSIYMNIDSNLPNFFMEGTTELISNEYFNENPYIETSSYKYEICAVKALCEVVGSNTVLEAFTKNDINILLDKLTLINNDSTKSENIINGFKVLFNNENYTSNQVSEINRCFSSLWETFDNAIYLDYDKDNRDRYNAFCYNLELLSTKFSNNSYEDYNNYIEENGACERLYFNKESNTKDSNKIKTK